MMKSTTRLLSAMGIAAALATAATAQPVNFDFTSGLDGWTVAESGGDQNPGTVMVEGGQAVLREGDSFSVSLAQRFVAPAGLVSLSCDITPEIDETGGPIPDAIEISVENNEGFSLLPTWTVAASTVYNLPERGAVRLGEGASVTNGRLTVDLSTIAPETEATLRFSLVGADDDTGSLLRIGPIMLTVNNRPPVAHAGSDVTIACAAGGLTLDGSGSSDPDEDMLTYVWRDSSGAEVGTSAMVTLDAEVGQTTYTLEVKDAAGQAATDTVEVTVIDTTDPTMTEIIEPAEITVDSQCEAIAPTLSATVTDSCAGGALSQVPAAGAPLSLGSNAVTLTATDDAGNTVDATVTVTVVDPDGVCEEPPIVNDDSLVLSGGGGCSCETGPDPAPTGLLFLLVATTLIWMRRRRNGTRTSRPMASCQLIKIPASNH